MTRTHSLNADPIATQPVVKTQRLKALADECEPVNKSRLGGFEPPTDGIEVRRTSAGNSEKPGIFQGNVPSIVPREFKGDVGLKRVINAWPTLSQPTNRAVLALIDSVQV